MGAVPKHLGEQWEVGRFSVKKGFANFSRKDPFPWPRPVFEPDAPLTAPPGLQPSQTRKLERRRMQLLLKKRVEESVESLNEMYGSIAPLTSSALPTNCIPPYSGVSYRPCTISGSQG